MQPLVLFWIALCLVVDTNTRSVSSTDDETGTGDPSVLLHDNADDNQTAEVCKCENGFCEKKEGGILVCKCLPEWGLFRPTYCEKCDCGKDSNCTFSDVLKIKSCICKVGYADRNGVCRATCSQNPCQNGGTCKVTGDEWTCQCKEGFAGPDCSEEDCKCENGFCEKNDEGKWICKCPPEWGLLNSTYCRRTCHNGSDCLNGGRCGTSHFCVCPKGTEGDFCEEIPDCKYMDCGPDARCTYDVVGRRAECSCENEELLFDDKEGTCRRTCEDDSDCMNGANCERNGPLKFCSCLNGTEGERCEEVTECKHLDCGPDARCTYDARREKASCSCNNDDLVFDDKQRRCKNVCSPNPCQNGGTCNATREVTCQCKDHFRGADCSIDVCSPNPCQNGGTCNATRGEVTCQCKDRFRGADCSIDVCSPNPCQNGGTCNATRGEVTCQCKERFRGADCSIDICSPNPCRNGGVCNVTRKGVICQCRDRFRGADCSVEIPLIATSTSVQTMNVTRNSTILSTSSPSRHSLNITVSTLGLTTIVPTTGTDPCTGSPCQNGGTCVTVGNKRKCLCKKPYLGNLCETDPCDWNPCKNGGMCRTEFETVRCFCRDPFTGEFCESRIRTDTYVITLVGGSVFLAVLLTFATCILCQKYHVMRSRSEYN